MAGVRKKPTSSGKYQGWYADYTGIQQFFTGTRKKAETLQIAHRLEDEHRQIRLGYRPVPSTSDQYKGHSFEEVKSEYLAWGNSQGGRNGFPWSPTHAANRRRHLGWWQNNLSIQTLGDLDGILPRVEKALRDLQGLGRSGKTVANYAEALGAFCDWCVKRGYLATDPLVAMAPFDTTPETKRRAMTVDEINRLLGVAPTHRRILYETAFLSGLRANELRNLTVAHLDVDRGGLHLDAAWTKIEKADSSLSRGRSLID